MVSLSRNTAVPPIQYWDIKKKNNAGINTFKCILTLKLIFFVTLFSCEVPWKRLEHSRTTEKLSTTSGVSLYTSFVL